MVEEMIQSLIISQATNSIDIFQTTAREWYTEENSFLYTLSEIKVPKRFFLMGWGSTQNYSEWNLSQMILAETLYVGF